MHVTFCFSCCASSIPLLRIVSQFIPFYTSTKSEYRVSSFLLVFKCCRVSCYELLHYVINSLLVLQDFTTARKSGNTLLTYCWYYRIKQHVPTSIRKESNTVREQPPHICKKNNSKISCESAIEQHLIANPECAKTYTDDNFRIIEQAGSSFHLSVLESVCIKTQNPVLSKQKEFVFSLGLFK